MKSLRTLLVLLLCLTTAVTYSQTQRTRVFTQFPDIIDCAVSQFNNAFSAKPGESITLSFSGKFTFTGKVISNVQKYENLQSMTISLPGYANTIFHLSRQTNDDGNPVFVGRILGSEALDGYQIIKEQDGNYKFKKIEEDKIRQLCSQ